MKLLLTFMLTFHNFDCVLCFKALFDEYLSVFSCSHLSTVLGNKFDHGAEAIVPVLFNLIPNCAKVMATSGVSAIRIIIRVSLPNINPFQFY